MGRAQYQSSPTQSHHSWPESTLLATSSLRIRSGLTPTACLLRHGGLVALPWEMPHGIRVDVSRYPMMGGKIGGFRMTLRVEHKYYKNIIEMHKYIQGLKAYNYHNIII